MRARLMLHAPAGAVLPGCTSDGLGGTCRNTSSPSTPRTWQSLPCRDSGSSAASHPGSNGAAAPRAQGGSIGERTPASGAWKLTDTEQYRGYCAKDRCMHTPRIRRESATAGSERLTHVHTGARPAEANTHRKRGRQPPAAVEAAIAKARQLGHAVEEALEDDEEEGDAAYGERRAG